MRSLGIRRSASRGVALLETAIIAPFIILLFLGVVESGFALRDANNLARAVQQSARSDARLADNPLADYEALRSLDSSLGSLTASSLDRVIIYDAGATGDSPPAACLALARPDDFSVVGNGTCNVYSPSQVAADQPSSFGCAGGWDSNFCPTNPAQRQRTGDNPTKVGVWVEVNYDKVTSILPGNIKLTRAAVYQLEPCVAGDPTC